MLVLVLVGLVMGAGLGAFAGLDLSRAQATDIVRGALRTARGGAVARRGPARVRIGQDRRTLVPLGLTVLGTWHFETADLTGAGSSPASVAGARLTEHGYLGNALELPAGTDVHASFPVHTDPAFDFADGFSLECTIAADKTGSAHVVSVGGSFGLYVRASGAVRAWFVPVVDPADFHASPRPGDPLTVESRPGALRPGAWTRARATYDGRRFALFLDGVLAAELFEPEESRKVWPVDEPLVIGGGKRSFVGRVDRLVLSAWVAGDAWELPEGTQLAASVPDEIAFDASGFIDRRVHEGPFAITVVFDDGREEAVALGAWGTIE